jgi:DNA-binding PadR family transcriptional regulator
MPYPTDVTPRPLASCSSLQRDILITISGTGGLSGKELLTELRGQYSEDRVEIPKSTLYHHLGKLEEMDLVVKTETSRRTNEYGLSDLARERLLAYRGWVVDRIQA